MRGLRQLWGLAVLALIASASAVQAGDALGYLERLKGRAQYLAPSEIDARYTIALYVNTAPKGATRQRMWVLHRDQLGGPWRLAMWDKDYWKKSALGDGEPPDYSWPVSTGRYYRGDRNAGPTPVGVFSIDERRRRWGYGWLASGMVHVLHLDLHNRGDGRASGIAFHGTTRGRNRLLGQIDSHGCVRMHERNALALLKRVTGKDGVLVEDMRWGEVPRFWATEKGNRRKGYTRDGRPPVLPTDPAPAGAAVPAAQAPAAAADGATPPSEPATAVPAVPIKTGFRAISILFDDPS